MDQFLVLGLLMEQISGKSRALNANGADFTFLFYCVTVGKLSNCSVLQFPRGFISRFGFNAESYVPGALSVLGFVSISLSLLQEVLLLSSFYR